MNGFHYTAVVLTVASKTILGAPIGTKVEPTFVAEPSQRGTIGLLWSCAVTFGVCIWTAVHPDITPYSRRRDRVYYKLAWAMGAMLLPEIVFIIAFNQFRQAIYLRNLWCERFPDTLGLQGGFFILMGGFTIQRTIDDKTYKMTPKGFTQLVQLADPIPPPESSNPSSVEEFKNTNFVNFKKSILSSQNPFDKKNIDDKGKADSISKALVSGQVLWFLLQCIGRKLDRLPIMLLEIHVAIQVVYAIITYALWWYKPLDVSVPISITINEHVWEHLTRQKPPVAERQQRSETAAIATRGEPISANSEIEQATNLPMVSKAASAVVHNLPTEDSPDDTCFPIEKTLPFSHAVILNISYLVAEHLTFAGIALGPFIAMGLGIVNGTLHATAWNSHFPSHIEALLWKISCFGVGWFPFAMFMALLFQKIKDPTSKVREVAVRALSEARMDKSWQFYSFWEATDKLLHKISAYLTAEENERQDTLSSRFRWVFKFTVFMFSGYLICMLYLTVESFISIRSMPEGSYSVASWSQFLPHI